MGARPTGDLDVLIPDQPRRAAFEALRAAGWSPVAAAPGFDEADYHEVEWKRGGVFLDLHFALAPLPRCGIDYRAVWRDKVALSVEDRAAFRLSDAHDA